MIKWLWRLVVGCGCWGRECRWIEIERRELLNTEKQRIGASVYQECKICGHQRVLRLSPCP